MQHRLIQTHLSNQSSSSKSSSMSFFRISWISWIFSFANAIWCASVLTRRYRRRPIVSFNEQTNGPNESAAADQSHQTDDSE